MIHLLHLKNTAISKRTQIIPEYMNLEKRKITNWLILPLCLIFTVACEKVLFEPVVVPDEERSFATDIQPILNSSCVECKKKTKNTFKTFK